MALDMYMPCPCGSGKKLKFCRCKDSLAENEQVFELANGGQIVAALDRINQLLDRDPTVAWLYRLKGEILMQMAEFDRLAECSDRFLQLQPSNPVAHAQRAAVLVHQGVYEKACQHFVQAFAESEHGLDTLISDVGCQIAYGLLLTGRTSTAIQVYTLLANVDGVEISPQISNAFNEFLRAPSVHPLLKSAVRVAHPPIPAAASERLSEAVGLLQRMRVSEGEVKLESLDRQFPGEPAIIDGLYRCAVMLGDVDRQRELLLSASQCERLSHDDQTLLVAAALAADAHRGGMAKLMISPSEEVSWELKQVDQIQAALASDLSFFPLPEELLRQVVDEEEVPPRAGFQVLSEPFQRSSPPPIDQFPRAQAIVLLFGRQTDRAPMLVLQGIPKSESAAIEARLSKHFGNDVVGPPKRTAAVVPLRSLFHTSPPAVRVSSREEARKITVQMRDRYVVDLLLNASLQLFGGKTPLEAAADPATQRIRDGFFRFLRADAEWSEQPQALERIREAIGAKPIPSRPLDQAMVNELQVDALATCEVPQGLSGELLAVGAQASQTYGLQHTLRLVGKALLEANLPAENEPLRALGHEVAMGTAAEGGVGSFDIAATAAKDWSTKHAPERMPYFLLSEAQYRAMLLDMPGLQRTINRIMTDYRQDKDVIMRLQVLLIELGILNPDGSPRQPGRPAAAPAAAAPSPASGGLWTPDGPTSATPPASAGQAAGSGSKIWLPGME
jgi:tetratricopeptide (TPR) repeat protein